MSTGGEKPDEFERHTQEVLHQSLTRVDSRVRSRLNQARQAALEELSVRPRSFWRAPALMPATGAVAAVAVIAVLLSVQYGRDRTLPILEGSSQAALEDLEMLSDKEGLDLIEGWDGSFYEWAAAQGETGEGGASG